MYKLKLSSLLIICFVICGCSLLDCSNCDIDRNDVVAGGAIMNDSMVILNTYVKEEEFCSAFGAGGGTEYRTKECKLILADIRFKKVYWEKRMLDCDLRLNSIQDSMLFFRNGINFAYLNFEDLRQTERIYLKSKKMEFEGGNWKYESLTSRIRPWQNGLVLVNSKYMDSHGRYGNEYALLDTVTGIGKLWQPSGEFEWLNECMDAKWSSIGGLCLKEIPDTLGFVLLKNGVDTLGLRYPPNELPSYYREEVSLTFNGNGVISGGWIYLISDQGGISEKPLDVWVSQMGIFSTLSGKKISYGII
jgi:hypothetical protein